MKWLLICIVALSGTFLAGVSQSHAQSFSDVSESHPAYEAIEALKDAGVLQGYDDGTFKPSKSVNRAEAVKMIAAPLLTVDLLAQAKTTVYDDVPEGVWYLPYIEWARQVFEFIDGPPKKTSFYGGNTVILVEFLKMLQLANGVDPNNFNAEVRLPLANDVTNVDEWYYPYMRYALSASMLSVDEEVRLYPGKNLTRADTAMLLYHFLLYQRQGRTQELLNQTESNIGITLQAWGQGLPSEAEYASARALLTARGAHVNKPDDPVTNSALTVATAFRSLVRGYRAGIDKDYAEAERLAGEAWDLADQVEVPIAEQIRTLSKTMAESARELLAQ